MPAKFPIFFIVGPAGHGKTTVRSTICALTGQKGASCSDVIEAHLCKAKGITPAEYRKTPKEERRPEMIRYGDWITGTDGLRDAADLTDFDKSLYRAPSALVRILTFTGHTVIAGVRRRLELQQSIEHLNWAGYETKVIYVFNPRGPKIEDNTEDLRDLADHILENKGTMADLRLNTHALLNALFPEPEQPEAPETKPAEQPAPAPSPAQ